MRALKRIGLDDEKAGKDVEAMRDLLRSYRDMRSTVWSTVTKWVTTMILVAITAAVAAQYWERR